MSDQELKPCDCGADINETFRIQELWRGLLGQTVGVAYCEICTKSVPFQGEFHNINEVSEAAYKAWNTRQHDKARYVDIVKSAINTTPEDVKRQILAAIEAVE